MDFIKQLYTDYIGVWFFYGPLVINGICYPIELWLRIQSDKEIARKKKEKKQGYYHDSDFVTVGTIFWYIILIVTPVLNALATIFDAAPTLAKRAMNRFGWLLNIKLVKLEKVE